MSTPTPLSQIAKTMGILAIGLLSMRVLLGSASPGDQLLFQLTKNKFFVTIAIIALISIMFIYVKGMMNKKNYQN